MYKIFITCFLFLIEFSSFGQCDDSLTPTRNEKINYKSRGNRCEGEFSAKVGAPSLEIANLTIGKFSYLLDRNESIKIENTTSRSINIRSTAIPIDTYYRMDASLDIGQNLIWKIEDIIYYLKIPSGLLGVYGWIGSNYSNRTYFPIKPISSTYDEKNKNVYLLIRPSSKVLSVKYRYTPIEQSQNEYKTIGGSFRSGEPIEIILPANLEGIYIIEVQALLESKGDWTSVKYKVSFQ